MALLTVHMAISFHEYRNQVNLKILFTIIDGDEVDLSLNF